jgi:hypothetical protein
LLLQLDQGGLIPTACVITQVSPVAGDDKGIVKEVLTLFIQSVFL